MHNCFLLLGSNQGNRVENLSRAMHVIRNKIGKIHRVSAIYETEAWGFESKQHFYNMVISTETELGATEALRKILEIETALGRQRKNNGGYTSRLIDIDILFFNDEIIDDPQLQIPHPRLHQRMFTLMPLMEVSPKKIHPVFGKPISELINQCTDKLMVKKIGDITKE
ncbi:MAG: 2-amino-4-hydroxy-6-hydroxymethyldihydropteridine diphosphokinase [Bacteroidetes bacterium 4484_276]|nr:MAG: 2-amino-4-hydroxy-6-hydroxymethyldihydropteridine diphosphokinase [Bacteroidetes bacterium 4484_276]OYT12780.1 MAG: 2-amino-4-hydroxy-6-hydroxymethyldihydropteridine diphosphokinase [Bacteroidetes bacterium 4572_114]